MTRAVQLPPHAEITERDFQRQVVDIARVCGWHVAHFRPAQTDKGWRTPVEADAAGFPDLLLARERLVCVELKVRANRLSQAQLRWQLWLETAGVEYHVFRPIDMRDGRIEEVLRAVRRSR